MSRPLVASVLALVVLGLASPLAPSVADDAETRPPRKRFFTPKDPRPAHDPYRLVAMAAPPVEDLPRSASSWDVDAPSPFEWLRAEQDQGGRWRRTGLERDAVANALALLPFFANGQTHRFGSYKKTVHRGLIHLRRLVEAGSLGRATVLTQALVAFTLAEAYLISRYFTLRYAVARSIHDLCAARMPGSGWSWEPRRGPANSLATVYAVRAIQMAEQAKLPIGRPAIREAHDFLREVTDPETGRAGYRRAGDADSITLGEPTEAAPVPLLTAAVTHGRLLCGESPETLAASAAVLERHPPTADRACATYWHLGSRAALQLGGATWERWRTAIAEVVWTLRTPRGGTEPGSWAPSGVLGESHGRLATTAEAFLAVDSYWRWERAEDAKRSEN